LQQTEQTYLITSPLRAGKCRWSDDVSAAYHRRTDLLVPLWTAASWHPSVGMKQAWGTFKKGRISNEQRYPGSSGRQWLRLYGKRHEPSTAKWRHGYSGFGEAVNDVVNNLTARKESQVCTIPPRLNPSGGCDPMTQSCMEGAPTAKSEAVHEQSLPASKHDASSTTGSTLPAW